MSVGKGLVEVNTRLRADEGRQKAFGRIGCAEQSIIQQTLDATTAENIKQMQKAMEKIYQEQSLGIENNYNQQLQILDIDFTEMTCGKLSEEAKKRYFPENKADRGRQIDRVLAIIYQKIVLDKLYVGNIQLKNYLQELVIEAERVWFRYYISISEPKLANFGLLLLVRDIIHITGVIVSDLYHKVLSITFNQVVHWASILAHSLKLFLASTHISFNLGKI